MLLQTTPFIKNINNERHITIYADLNEINLTNK